MFVVCTLTFCPFWIIIVSTGSPAWVSVYSEDLWQLRKSRNWKKKERRQGLWSSPSLHAPGVLLQAVLSRRYTRAHRSVHSLQGAWIQQLANPAGMVSQSPPNLGQFWGTHCKFRSPLREDEAFFVTITHKSCLPPALEDFPSTLKWTSGFRIQPLQKSVVITKCFEIAVPGTSDCGFI
jgi:hypothetical protein